MEFIYTKNPNEKEPIIVVNKHIGSDKESGDGIMGTQFMDEVFELKRNGVTKGEVWINSPGGSMLEGYNIQAGIGIAGVEFDTLNYGIAASSSGWIWLKGRKVKMTSNAIFMCHDPSNDDGSEGTEQKAFRNSVAVMISEGSGRNAKPKITVEEAERMMSETTFLDAEQCYNMGLCDEIVANNYADTYKPVSTSDFYLFGNKIYNSLLKSKTMNLTSITNVLELQDGVSESVIEKSINALKAKANRVDVLESTNNSLTSQIASLTAMKNESEQGMTTAVNEMEDLKNKINALEGQYNTLAEEKTNLTNKLNEMENASKMEAENRMESDCRNMVNSFSNRIGSDTNAIADWVNTAKVLGIEKTKNMLEKLPVVGKAPSVAKIVDQTNAYVAPTGKTPAENLMNELRAGLDAKRNKAKLTSIN